MSKRILIAPRGYFKHPLYNIWRGMVGRCHNPKDKDFMRWGGRGIIVCDRWKGNFPDFIADIESTIGPRTGEKSIDRVDNNGNYELGNIRWATRKEQANNRRGLTDEYKRILSARALEINARRKGNPDSFLHLHGNKFLAGKIWITNGIQNKVVKPEEEIPSGWRRGRTLHAA